MRARTEVADINDVLASFDLQNPMDIEFGPNGSLYVLNYGNGFFGQNQPGAELVADRLPRPSPGRQLRSDGERRRPTPRTGSRRLPFSFTSDVDDPEAERSATSGTSTRTARSTRVRRTRPTRSPRTACSARR